MVPDSRPDRDASGRCLSGEYAIRPIGPGDNPAVATIIRDVMTELGAVGTNFSISDPEVDAMFEAYPAPDSAFFVIERDGKIMGCGGMGPLQGGEKDVCELKKMYFLPGLRGAGMGRRLLDLILDSARAAGYRRCYLETLSTMDSARALYRKYGFRDLDGPMGNTGHSGCNRFMILVL